MNWRTSLFSLVAAGITTFVAHHSGWADLGVFAVALSAHLLHVPITSEEGPQ